MTDKFKLTAQKLKRYVKVAVDMPTEYIKTDTKYPCIIALDGDLFYNYIGEDTKRLDITSALRSSDKKPILVSISAPKIPDWRTSELNPYYNGNNKDVDTVLSYIFFEYINNEFIPFIKERYRISDDIYLLGLNEGAIAALYLLYRFNIFKGAGLFNPTLNQTNIKMNQDLQKNFNKDKKVYLYFGQKDSSLEDSTLFYNLYTSLESLKIDNILLDYNNDLDNSYEAYESRFNEFINYILK